MAIVEDNQPLFLDSQHLLVAVVATIAAQHGVEKTRELVDELADNDATWAAIAQKVGDVQPEDSAGEVVDEVADPGPDAPAVLEPGAGDVAGALLDGEGIESAGPDGVAIEPSDDAGDVPRPPTENGAAHP